MNTKLRENVYYYRYTLNLEYDHLGNECKNGRWEIDSNSLSLSFSFSPLGNFTLHMGMIVSSFIYEIFITFLSKLFLDTW